MPNFLAPYFLSFSATAGGDPTTGTSGTASNNGLPSGVVVDVADDGNIDSGDCFIATGFAYHGWTVTINGNSYAVFENANNYYIPYDPDFDNLADFTDTSQWVFANTGENAIVVNCFLAGTLIATPGGERAVETLAIGDSVLTEDGRAVAVKWIGRQTVFTAFGPAERLMPVRLAAGSLGEGLPHADLTVTADHGMLIDGVICHAGALVNGTTITNVPLSEFRGRYTVYHIETEEHEIILANGAPAETFIDNVSRRCFDNFAEFEALYGSDVPEMEELDYPRAMSVRQVPPRIKAKLDGRKAA